MRRFLDKKYITNGITYTGSLHSLNYIFNLVKYFDFKITHASYHNDKSIDEINKFIKTSTIDDSAILNKYLYPMEFSQCIDMNIFPPDFE